MSPGEYFGDWRAVVDVGMAEHAVNSLLKEKAVVCPVVKDVFKAFEHCSYGNLRCVVLGQDPYPQLRNGRPIAQGIAFANANTTRESDYSPSLKVLMESVIDFSIPHNNITFDPTLVSWEEQGVLLLNSSLSCKVGSIGSHILMWRPFIVSLLRNLSKYNTGIVYVLMGNVAQSFEDSINPRFNTIFKCPHPSYYARTGLEMPHSLWVNINKILIEINGYGIEWYEKQENQECHHM